MDLRINSASKYHSRAGAMFRSWKKQYLELPINLLKMLINAIRISPAYFFSPAFSFSLSNGPQSPQCQSEHLSQWSGQSVGQNLRTLFPRPSYHRDRKKDRHPGLCACPARPLPTHTGSSSTVVCTGHYLDWFQPKLCYKVITPCLFHEKSKTPTWMLTPIRPCNTLPRPHLSQSSTLILLVLIVCTPNSLLWQSILFSECYFTFLSWEETWLSPTAQLPLKPFKRQLLSLSCPQTAESSPRISLPLSHHFPFSLKPQF